MEKGTRCRVTVQRNILASGPKKAPTRFSCGEVLTGTFETKTADEGLCFYVTEVGDFVFFPPGAIAYEEIEEAPHDLARRVVAEKPRRDQEDPRLWAQQLAKDISDADD